MSDAEQTFRLHATIEGRVQGVGFRYFVLDKGEALGLSGWVRNRWDGSVEVVAEGPRPALDRLKAALNRGPRSAHVTRLEETWETPTGEFTSFRVLPTR